MISIYPINQYTLCLKNETGVAHDNFIAHQLILVVFSRDVAEYAIEW